jgi:ATP-dependent DNA helicase RecG
MGIRPSVSCFKWEGKTILRIDVGKSPNPISYNGEYYKRVGSTTTRISKDELGISFQGEVTGMV